MLALAVLIVAHELHDLLPGGRCCRCRHLGGATVVAVVVVAVLLLVLLLGLGHLRRHHHDSSFHVSSDRHSSSRDGRA